MNNPTLSVCIITYNQEKYISKCIEGALLQSTNFPIEININDDNSSDSTALICQNYAAKYPNKIKFFKNERNLGMIGNWVESIKRCSGKYIAICEGDDYWTNSLKLQKQVNHLEENPDCNITFHDVEIVNAKGKYISEYYLNFPKPKIETDIYEFAVNKFIPTLSLMFRNDFEPIPDWFFQCRIADYPLIMLKAKMGKFSFIDEKMGCYRVHDQGVWSKTGSINAWENVVKTTELLYENLCYDDRLTDSLGKSLMKSKMHLIGLLIKSNNITALKEQFSYLLSPNLEKAISENEIKELLDVVHKKEDNYIKKILSKVYTILRA